MTLVGKIFAGLVFLMSLCFFALVIMVLHTHNSWKQLVLGKHLPNHQVNLNEQIAQLDGHCEKLTAEKSTLENLLSEERAARQRAKATLLTKVEQLETRLTSVVDALAIAKSELDTLLAAGNVNADALAKYQNENVTLRDQTKVILFARDQLLKTSNDLNQDIHEVSGQVADLNVACEIVDAELEQRAAILFAIGASLDDPPIGSLQPAPGVITRVGERELVEISLGSDDGVRVGMRMHVYGSRGDYAGKIRISSVREDRAAGAVIPSTRNRPVRSGDNVVAESTIASSRR